MLSNISNGLRNGSLGDVAASLLSSEANQAGRLANSQQSGFPGLIQNLMQNATRSMLGF